MIRQAAVVAIFTCAACGVDQQYRETQADLQHYAMMQTRGDLTFLPGGLGQDDLAGEAPEQYARLQKASVTCRSDIVVSGRGLVTHICTSCSNKDQYAFRVSDSFVRRLRFKTGAEGRAGALTLAYAPMRADASLILPRVAAPETGCAPQPVIQ